MVARLSSNFYSLLGTEDEKTAQTESPRSFLSRYTCSFPSLHLLNFLVHHPLTLSSFVPSTPYPSPFPFDQRCSPQVTDSTLPLPLVSTMLHSLTFYLLIDESRVNPIGSGPPPLDKISLIRSRPSKVFLPLCFESLLLETLCFLGNFLITTADACFISFLSLLFFSLLKFYPLRFRISSFFRGLLFSLCGSCDFARSCILFLKYPLLPSSGPPEFDLLLLLLLG